MQLIVSFFEFLDHLIIKMTWLDHFVDVLLLDVFNMDPQQFLYASISFFLYDVIKILLLLFGTLLLTTYIQTYITPEKTKQILSRFNGFFGYLIGALIGTITPFCSCSSIPIFIAFTKAKLPIGVTFAFLISSPLVDFASIILIASIFGWTVAILYVSLGVVLAVIGGFLISIFGMEKYVVSYLRTDQVAAVFELTPTQQERFHAAFTETKLIVKKVFLYVVIGVMIGAIIHGYIPQTLIESILGPNNPFAVILATLAGAPIYADTYGTLSIAQALVDKGVGLGTVISFMMATTALSIPSILLLKQVLKKELLFTFVSMMIIGIIVIGYSLNVFQIL